MDNHSSVLEVQSGGGKFGGFHFLSRIDPENPPDLNVVWERLKTQDYAFDDFSRGNVEAFLLLLANPANQIFRIGDHGLFLVLDAKPRGAVNIHFVVWDRNFSLHRDKRPAYELLDYLFYEVKVHRVSGAIPVYNKLAPAFAYSMGMKYEGELIEAVLWNGKYYNVQLFGLLEEWYRKRKERIKQ